MTSLTRPSERKLLSILFADIVQSTALIHSLDPEDAIALLEPVIKIMSDAVHQYGGLISSQRGDGIMAIFGAPDAIDDHAIRACFAALRMQTTVQQTVTQKIRVGIHSGEVILRLIQHDLTSTYDASGPAVSIAQKIESSAEPGGILVSDACGTLTGGIFDFHATSHLTFKNPNTDVSVKTIPLLRLAGIRPYSRWQARAAVGLSSFVGRKIEMATLRAAAVMAQRGEILRLTIEGEPGSGKSRLGREFLAEISPDEWSSFEIYGELTTQRTPWGGARRILEAVAAGDEDTSVDYAFRRFSSNLDSAEYASLCGIFGQPSTSTSWLDETPQIRLRMISRLLGKLIVDTAIRLRKAIVIFADDAQWIDIESINALQILGDESPKVSILIIFVCRAPLERVVVKSVHERISLAPLSISEARGIAEKLVGAKGSGTDDTPRRRVKSNKSIIDLIVNKAGGVPLYIEELIKYLADVGILIGNEGKYATGVIPPRIGIPPTVQSVIAARMDRLSREARSVIEIACIIGDHIRNVDIKRISIGEVGDLRTAIAELVDSGMIVTNRFGFGFAHDLIRDVCYTGLIRERRRQLYRRALDCFPHDDGSISSGQLEKLHRYAVGAEEWLKAVGYARLAAAKAIESSAYQSSLMFLESALSAIERLEPTKSVTELEIDLRLETRIALGATTQLNQLLEHATKAETKARAIGDHGRALVASIHKASALTYIGSADESLGASSTALKAALSAKIPQIELLARYILAQSNYVAGRLRLAAHHIAVARQQLPQEMQNSRMGTTGTTLVLLDVMEAVARAGLGEFSNAEERLIEAADVAERTRRPYDHAALAYGETVVAMQSGAVVRAISTAEPALDLVRKYDLRFFFPLIANQLGSALVASGEAVQSLEPLRQSLSLSTELGHMAAKANAGAALGSAFRALGRYEEAEEMLRWALDLSRQQGFDPTRIVASRTLGQLLSLADVKTGEADSLFAEAIETAVACEARPQLARSQFALAGLRFRQGHYEDAETLTAQATSACVQMGIKEIAVMNM
jgi:class 3 adenylate cyclase/tetratricopeptide (TPR) repeat protein